MALPVVLLILVAIMLISLASTNFAIQGERAGRNERDFNLAFQAAEAALRDAETDIAGGTRQALIEDLYPLPTRCVKPADDQLGLCATPLGNDAKPVWQTIDLADPGISTGYGQFTAARCLPSQPGGGCAVTSMQGVARQPRYIIEKLMSPGLKQQGAPEFVYRITAIGFGVRDTSRVTLQSLYKPN